MPRVRIDAGLIRIIEVMSGDEGEFLCEASNSIGNISKRIQLVLTGITMNQCSYFCT